MSDDGGLVLRIQKSCATNASVADLAIVSAWTATAGGKPRIDAHLIEIGASNRTDLVPHMSVFKSGFTGSLKIERIERSVEAVRLGKEGLGLEVLKRCFDLERIYIPAFVAGLLRGLEENLLTRASTRERVRRHPAIQEKLATLFQVRLSLESLIERVLVRSGGERLSDSHKELSALKLIATGDALDAALAAFEAIGHDAVTQSNPCGKAVRDLTAIRYFGGTRELHQGVIAETLLRESEPALPTGTAREISEDVA